MRIAGALSAATSSCSVEGHGVAPPSPDAPAPISSGVVAWHTADMARRRGLPYSATVDAVGVVCFFSNKLLPAYSHCWGPGAPVPAVSSSTIALLAPTTA